MRLSFPKNNEEPAMKDHKILCGVTAFAVLIFAAWAWGWFDTGQYSEDPKVAELEKFRDANITQGEPPREVRQEMRDKMEGLSPEQRMAFFESSMPIFVPMMAKRFEEEYDKFAALSPEEQRKKLDERIDEMEKRGGPGGPGGPSGNRPPIDSKKMNEIAKKMLDWTTPDQRTKFENGMRMMNERRAERGLQPLPPMGGF
jgi:hypothetical protein